MNIGMLWYDNDQTSEIITKIQRAANYYQEKYGADPNICFVNPGMLKQETQNKVQKKSSNGKITIKTSPSILPNHFWIGINGTSESP